LAENSPERNEFSLEGKYTDLSSLNNGFLPIGKNPRLKQSKPAHQRPAALSTIRKASKPVSVFRWTHRPTFAIVPAT
jgi:hypothetical protein